MKNFLDKELRLFAPVYFFLAFINLRVKLFLTPAWFNGRLLHDHQGYLLLQGVNNDQSRVLHFLIPEFFHRLFALSIEDSYILQRWLFVFLAFVCFHQYLRKWFDATVSFAGVLFLAAVMPLGYFNHLQESSPLLLLTFLLGLWAIRERRLPALAAVFFAGGLNNETMLILPLAYFAYNYEGGRWRALLLLCGNTLLVSLPLLLTVGPIRYLTRHRPHGGEPWQWPFNLQGIGDSLRLLGSPELTFLQVHRAVYLYIFFLFGAFWVYAFWRWREKPLFLRRAALIIPFFILAHMFTGIIYEVRQMFPLSFLVIPMALCYLFPARDDGAPAPSGSSRTA